MKRSLLKECLRIAISKNTAELHPEFENYKHYSFVIQNNKLVEWSTNRPGTAKDICGFKPKRNKRHAEVEACRRARGLLKKNKSFDIVNIRLSKKGEMRNSAPCKCCKAFLQGLSCKNIYFSTNVGWSKLV